MVAERKLKREAQNVNIPYRKLANPPRTRWNGKLNNYESVLHLKKPLQNLMSQNDNWHKYALILAEWKLPKDMVTLLKLQ